MIKIFTYSFNNPKYLEYQNKLLKKFLTEPFEFICIDNSIDMSIRQQLREVCNTNNIRYEINQKPDHSLHGTSHYSAVQWSFDTFMANGSGIAVILDHDMFPIKPISIKNLLNNADIAGAPQSGQNVTYLHPSLIIMNLDTLTNKSSINFNGAKINEINFDIGANLHFYFKENPTVKIKYLASRLIEENHPMILPDLKKYYDDKIPFELVEDSLLHTRIGSNWAHINSLTFNNRNSLIYNIFDLTLNN